MRGRARDHGKRFAVNGRGAGSAGRSTAIEGPGATGARRYGRRRFTIGRRRGRPGSDEETAGFQEAAHTANEPRLVEGPRLSGQSLHFSHRLNSCRKPPVPSTGCRHESSLHIGLAAERGTAGPAIVAGRSAGSVFRVKTAPRVTVMSHRTASSNVLLLGLRKPIVVRFGLIDRCCRTEVPCGLLDPRSVDH